MSTTTVPIRRTTPLYRGSAETLAGPFTVLTDVAGEVHASGFTTDVDELLGLLRPASRATVELVDPPPGEDPTGAALDAVRAYMDGDLTALDGVVVRQDPDPERPVAVLRQRLRAVPAGETRSYAGLAADAGLPRASRAAGQACARNVGAPFVPCHRVLRSDGALGGYRWGLEVKRRLLDHEARHAG